MIPLDGLSVIYGLVTLALIRLSILDIRHFEIPPGMNALIGGLGIIRMGMDFQHWQMYVMGFFSVAPLLWIVYLLTKGRGIGGGDIKLMAVSGLVLGWQKNILAFLIGGVFACLIQCFCLGFKRGGRRFAFGPYLALGICLSMYWGEKLISVYLNWPGLAF